MPADGPSLRERWRAATWIFRLGPLRVYVWPRPPRFPWLVQWRWRQWWLFDRGQNLASPDEVRDAR